MIGSTPPIARSARVVRTSHVYSTDHAEAIDPIRKQPRARHRKALLEALDIDAETDLGLLQSALGTTETTFDGDFIHTELFEMAGAYLFHIVRNHPFVDGNKRTGLMGTLVFVGLNDFELAADSEDLFELVSSVPAGEDAKAAVAVFMQRYSRARDSSGSQARAL